MASVKCVADKNWITKFQTKQDGLSCWIALVQEPETGENSDNTKTTLEDELNTLIHNRQQGGINQFVQDFALTIQKLIEAGDTQWEDDTRAKRKL